MADRIVENAERVGEVIGAAAVGVGIVRKMFSWLSGGRPPARNGDRRAGATLESLQKQLDEMKIDRNSIQDSIAEGIASISGRLEGIDGRLEGIDDRMAGIERRVGSFDERINQGGRQMVDFGERVADLERARKS